jgi:glycosyltransferase involved in cell wall biosynthesis
MTKHILIITDNLPNQINGVVTTYTNIQPYLVNKGYKVSYIHPGYFKHFSCPGYSELKLSIPIDIGKHIKRLNADYIHIATEGPLGLAAKLYLVKHKIRYTSAYHTKFPEAIKTIVGIPQYITWPIIRWFHNTSTTVLTTTSSMVSLLRSKGFKSVVSWTRGVDRNTFYATNNRQISDTILLCVSRVSAEKNLEDFFNLDYPAVRKIMVGDGPKLKEYKLKYPDIEFVGAKRGVELAKYYQDAAVFIFPSRWDTFGLVMIEAMACGTPVAAYPVQGPVDVIEQYVTGVMDTDLNVAVQKALNLNRQDVLRGSLVWDWEKAANIFLNSLVIK